MGRGNEPPKVYISQLSSAALLRRFKENNQELDCANLLRLAKDRGEERKPHCDRMVFEAVEILEGLLGE